MTKKEKLTVDDLRAEGVKAREALRNHSCSDEAVYATAYVAYIDYLLYSDAFGEEDKWAQAAKKAAGEMLNIYFKYIRLGECND